MTKTPNIKNFNRGTIAIGLVFLIYYFATALALPYGAGPDYDAHFDGARFIFSEGRLAVLPEDLAKLNLTTYGSTRALRPPLPYIVSAITAKTLSWTGIDLQILMRAGSAVLCSLTVALIFLTLTQYFQSIAIGLIGALLVGLMPQFAFIASHLNDDSAAIFSVTLLVFCLSRFVLRQGSRTLALATGIAIGLVILSKFTAWLFLPFGGIAILLLARPRAGQWVSSMGLMVLGVVLGGGWWIGFNIFHYGWHDPLLFQVGAQLSQQHMSLDPSQLKGFAAEGVSFLGLVLGDYKNFLDETLISAIGNLDWLRLRVGFPQYLLYTIVIGIALVSIPFQSCIAIFRFITGRPSARTRQFIFEGLLFLAIVSQFLIYAYYQWAQEIQVQGKYLIPILACPLILFFSTINHIRQTRFWLRYRPAMTFGASAIGVRVPLLALFAGIAIILVHVDAVRRFVIPYYHPPAQVLGLGPFVELDLSDPASIIRSKNLDIEFTDEGWQLKTITSDSQIELSPRFCDHFLSNNLISINFKSDGDGILQLFWSENKRFVARRGESSTIAKFQAGENAVLLAAGTGNCGRLRLDPTNTADQLMLIRSIAVAPMSITRFPYYFRIFKAHQAAH